MTSSRSRRGWILAPLLATSAWLALTGQPPPTDGAVVPAREATRGAVAMAPETDGALTPGLLALVPRETLYPERATLGARAAATSKHDAPRDLFAARNWNPPPPLRPAASAPPRPAAPPVPFTFLGKKHDGDAWEVYLGLGDKTLLAREGQVLNGTYRVERIAPPDMKLVYLPLDEAQALSIGERR
jgi:hypothetical protein